MRDAAHEVIRPRPRAGPLAGMVMSLVLAAVAAPLAMADGWFAGSIEVGKPAPVTVRVAPLAGFHGPRARLAGGSIVVARGEVPTAERANIAREVLSSAPHGWPALLVFFGGFAVIGLLYTANQRRSHRGRLLRTQAINIAVLLVFAAIIKATLLLSSMSVLVVPVAALALLATIVVDVSTGLALGVIAAAVFGALVPFDLGTIAVLVVQAGAGVLALGERGRSRFDLGRAGLFAGGGAAITYLLIYFFSNGSLPTEELGDPLRSAWLASFAAGPIAAVLAIAAGGIYHSLLGDVSKNTLVDLEDLSHPLLKQIAEKSPGTWQHSLAMANMAEIAANAIGANGRLVRTGAYYHDLGKTVQPKYFIENLNHGETSPHDTLSPAVSCDAIFAHVTEGVRLARKVGLPERIIDFMHMHHGDGLLEYFWAKNVEQGNPDSLAQSDFRYPGIKPQSKETAILAICDAVEAASRTLRNPDEASIRNLVQRIVYGKLHLGQLDESGMTMADLRKVSESLVETVKHTLHSRIEYPWQREERERKAAAEAEAEAEAEAAAREREREDSSANLPLVREPRLDSLDAPPPSTSRGRRRARAHDAVTGKTDPPPSVLLPPARVHKLPALIVDEDDDERRVTNPIPIARAVVPAPEVTVEPATSYEDRTTDEHQRDPDDSRKTDQLPRPPEVDQTADATPEHAAQDDPALFVDSDRAKRSSSLVDWEDALERAADKASSDNQRRKPSTVELLKSGDGQLSPLERERPTRRERAPSVHDEQTAERMIIPTKDAIRPSRVPTEPRDVVIPPEAFPNDDTAPTADIPVDPQPARVRKTQHGPPPSSGRKS